ncbi:MAG: outer membrane lipoprotein chaperone LolA [Legionellaceae bacterium]|nr:outer membrane lipoprotein chaperone LolA [Legionellaceae bacterium]
MNIRNRCIMIFILFCWLSQVFADANADELQTKLNAIHTMSASFEQVVYAKKRILSQSSGTMALSRPGLFRWQTKRPMAQLVVADGQRVWVYDKELEQVSVKKQNKNIGGAAALFLSETHDSVTQDFNVIKTQKNKKDYFDLRAKSTKANFERVILVFVGDILQGLELYDQLGQHTDVHLNAIKINPHLEPGLFKFKAPNGVDVVQQ